MCSATLGQIEELLSDSMTKIEDTHKRLAVIEEANLINARAHETIAQAVQLMAKTFKHSEDRQDKLEVTNQELYKAKTSAVSPNVFFMVTGTLCAIIIMGGIWITNTSIEATLTSFKAGKEQAEKMSQMTDRLIDEVKDGNK